MALNRNHSSQGGVVVPNAERYRGRRRGRGGRDGGACPQPLSGPRGGRQLGPRPGLGAVRFSAPRQPGNGPGWSPQSCPVFIAGARRALVPLQRAAIACKTQGIGFC